MTSRPTIVIGQQGWLLLTILTVLSTCAACAGSGGGGSSSGGSHPGGNGIHIGVGPRSQPLAIALEFSVANEAKNVRRQTIRASIPFPEGGYPDLSGLVVSGHQTAWLPMQYWADGTVKMAQAQFTDTLTAGQTKHYSIKSNKTPLTGAFTRNAWLAQAGANLTLGAEVRDTLSVPYRGVTGGAGEVVQETPLVQVRRWRTYHTAMNSSGIGRDYLSSTFYATEFRDMPLMLVDWIVGNDYQGLDDIPNGNSDPNLRPLGGPIDVKKLHFLCKGMSGVQPYLPSKEGVHAETAHSDGFTAFQVMENTWLGDGQTRRYRFLLRFEPTDASQADVDQWRTTANSMLARPLYALASHATWQDTKAAGLLGGPVRGPIDGRDRAEVEFQRWNNSNFFGTWGTHGDVKNTHTTGTPRNGPLSPELAHAIQGQHHRLLQKLEQKAWIQAARAYHLFGLTVPDERQLLLWHGMPHSSSHEQLGRGNFSRNDPYAPYRTFSAGQSRHHGWGGYDVEHFTVDLLFDYWCISGDAWAQEELRQLGESLKSCLRLHSYVTQKTRTVRSEGWAMQAFAQIYQATLSDTCKDFAIRRVKEILEPQRLHNHPSKALMFESNYAGTGFPMPHKYYMPYQYGALLYGFLGAYKSFEEPLLVTISENVLDMLEYSSISNFTDPVHGLVPIGLRYNVPVEHNGTAIPTNHWDNTPSIGVSWSYPFGSVHVMLIGGLFHLATMTQDQGNRERAEVYGALLFGAPSQNGRWSKWEFCIPKTYVDP